MAKNKKQIQKKINTLNKSISFWIRNIKQAYYLNPQAIKNRDNDEYAYRLAKGYRQNLPELYKELEKYQNMLP